MAEALGCYRFGLGANPGSKMGLIARVIFLVLFGIFMVVLEVNAFSGAWTWRPSQLLFAAVAVAILVAWIVRRRKNNA